jgi:Ca-activated chloride channel family protein
MNFAWPYFLLLLAAPAAWLAREISRARQGRAEAHPRIPRAEAGWRGLSPVGGGAARRRGAGARGWLCAGAALAIVGLARPQWGRIDEPVFDQSREVILALDLSRSMLSTDIKPSRLERSKLLIESLLDHLKGERVGLIIFSGTAFLQSPLSADYEILREFLPSLAPAFLPEGGTNYQAMIETALEAFSGGAAADHYLVVLSDGEATDDSWQSKIALLKKRGIHVIGLGVGTARGSMIPDGTGGFVKDDAGAVVLSKLESGTLKQLAEATGGSYRDASTWVDLPALIQATVAAGRKGQFVEHQSVRLAERFQWALAPALFCLLASFWREFPVRTKSRNLRLPESFGRGARPRAAPPPGLGVGAGAGAGATGGAGLGTRATAGATLLALLALSGLGGTLARASDNPTDENEQPPPETAALDAVVGRLAGQTTAVATDWSELARETINWGHAVESSHQAVAEGPVRDALAGVSAGERLDPDSKEWANLRSELEQLLKRARERKPPQASNSASDESSQQNPAPQQQQPQNQPPAGSTTNAKADAPPTANPPGPNSSPGDAPPPEKPKSDEANPPTKPDQPGAQSPRQPNRPPNGSSAFGDMTPSSSQGHGPTSQGDQGPQRKVGGTNIRPTADPASKDPALAGSLDKLQQLGDRDSPAELFELMRRGDPAAEPVKKGKTW